MQTPDNKGVEETSLLAIATKGQQRTPRQVERAKEATGEPLGIHSVDQDNSPATRDTISSKCDSLLKTHLLTIKCASSRESPLPVWSFSCSQARDVWWDLSTSLWTHCRIVSESCGTQAPTKAQNGCNALFSAPAAPLELIFGGSESIQESIRRSEA